MLTKEQVLTKCQVKSLDEVKKLTVWGSDIENIDLINEMPNLEVVSLSLNKISSLKPFENCLNLKELYLRKNNISDIEELKYLSNCKSLKILWLAENPVCDLSDYREKVLETLPQVMKLDNILTNCNNSQPSLPSPSETKPETPKEISITRELKSSHSSKRPTDATLVSNILKNYNSSMTITTETKNISNNNPSNIVKGEDYINKLDNIDDIKNFFASPYSKNNIPGEQPVKIKPKISGSNPVENFANFKPQSEKNLNSCSPITTNFAVTDSLNNITPKNVHVVTAILNLMEDLNLRELIHIRNHIIKKLKHN